MLCRAYPQPYGSGFSDDVKCGIWSSRFLSGSLNPGTCANLCFSMRRVSQLVAWFRVHRNLRRSPCRHGGGPGITRKSNAALLRRSRTSSARRISCIDFERVFWWARQDLNLGPTDYESAALTAELRARGPSRGATIGTLYRRKMKTAGGGSDANPVGVLTQPGCAGPGGLSSLKGRDRPVCANYFVANNPTTEISSRVGCSKSEPA